MKLFKKLFTVMFALTLVIGTGTRVNAETTPTPVPTEVDGADYDTAYFTAKADEVDLVGHTFNAVQILKATGIDTEAEDGPVYTGLAWGAQITDNGAALLTKLQADTTLKDDFKDFVTTTTAGKDLFTAAAFADTIKNYTAAQKEALIKVVKGLNLTGQTITVTKDMQPVKLDGGIGLYLIDDTTTVTTQDDVANATILMAAPGKNTINIKVDKPSQDKEVKENVKAGAAWNEVSDYNIGDYVPYKITSKVPDAAKFEYYTMTFTDEMSAGLTLADKVDGVAEAKKLVVKVGNTTLTADQYTLTITDDQHFTVELPVKGDSKSDPKVPGVIDGAQNFAAGADIVIEFYALLNSSAVIGLDGNTNKSKLEYSNNPDDDSSKGETPWDTVITFTYELDVNKIDGDTEEVLQGAQFALQATDGDHANKYVEVDANGKVTGWADVAPAADATNNPALLVSGADGIFKVIGLDDGTYSLVEIKAPKGYNTIDPITLVVKATTENGKDYSAELHDTAAEALTKLELTVNREVAEGVTSTGIVKTTVENNSGTTLPSTGGIGTTIFYVLGGLLIAGAGIVLVARRKAAE